MSTIALHSMLNISETVRDRGLVPHDHQYEMACGESNGHVNDDVTWPQRSNVWPQYAYCAISRKRLDMPFSNKRSLLWGSTASS